MLTLIIQVFFGSSYYHNHSWDFNNSFAFLVDPPVTFIKLLVQAIFKLIINCIHLPYPRPLRNNAENRWYLTLYCTLSSGQFPTHIYQVFFVQRHRNTCVQKETTFSTYTCLHSAVKITVRNN